MSTYKERERQEAIARLREILKPGDRVHVVVKHVSRSGMSRVIDAFKFSAEPDGQISKFWLSPLICRACGYSFDERREAVRIGGCGMDMGFALIYDLSCVLYPTYECLGEKCHAADHLNGDKNRKPHLHKDGYALRHEWL